nr:hypothetical protein GCM10020063_013670 [Dactylosporangium thailandense]
MPLRRYFRGPHVSWARAGRGEFPFDGTWQDFRPDPSWPMPNLPPNLL